MDGEKTVMCPDKEKLNGKAGMRSAECVLFCGFFCVNRKNVCKRKKSGMQIQLRRNIMHHRYMYALLCYYYFYTILNAVETIICNEIH